MRPRSVSRSALGCSKISLSMKSSKPPFSAASRSHSTCIVSGTTGWSARSKTSIESAVTTANSPSCNVTTSRVYSKHGRDVARDDVLALPRADDQRRVLARRDDRVGVVRVHDAQGVGALEPLERLGRGLLQVALVVALDQVSDGLGVGLRAQDVPCRAQLLAQLDVVLDDAVVHDGDLARAVDVRVGVLLARLAVRRPARVPDAHAPGDRDRADRVAQVDELADPAHHRQVAVLEDRDTC